MRAGAVMVFAGRAFATTLLLATGGCGVPPDTTGGEGPERPAVAFGDLEEIAARGTLRLARQRWDGFETLPRQGLPAESYFTLAEEFAARRELDVEWRVLDGFDELMPAVRDGLADVAVANITVTEARTRDVAFTTPLTRTREWVVGRPAPDGATSDLADLAGRTFGIPAGTAYVESVARHLPDASVVELPAGTDPHEVFEGLEAGRFDATVMDAVAARPMVAASERVERVGVLPDARDLAWAVRRENPDLLAALDAFLEERFLRGGDAPAHRDLAAIRSAGRLRMLTLTGPGTYYLWRGELVGFEYELLRAFAETIGVVLEVIVAAHREDLMPWLAAGRGDVVSAGVTATEERRAAAGSLFSTPYLRVQEVFVSRAPLGSLAELAGRRVTVQRGTSFVRTLEGLRGEVDLEIERSSAESESLIRAVAEARAEVTLADSHVADLEAAFDERLSVGPRLPDEMGLAWVVRPDQPELLAALNAFIESRYRGYDYNVLRNKYFRNDRRMQRQREHRIDGERLSPFDELVKAAAAEHGFDWRLVVSQMYQESGFDPAEESFAGARGLMQVLPRTAREVGIDGDALADPARGIEAGVRYLSWTRERFEALPLAEQRWFALAAYNAGVGHVRDARRLAAVKGWDAERWFDHVEHAMLLLSEREYARQALHGYVRGSEPVRYVDQIRERYRAYLGHFDALRAAADAGGSRS